MSKPLSNLDYLITKKTDNPPAREIQQTPMPSGAINTSSVERWMEEGVIGLATPILNTLKQAGGKTTMFSIVDALTVSADNLRPVLDLMANRYGWIDVDKSDLKGDWAVALTEPGRNYLQKTAR